MAIMGLMALNCAAQLVPTVNTVDFGEIRETEGPKSVRFFVRNDSADSISILKVRPTCGCTAADFYKDPIAPGDSAWVELTYNPSRRPGKFEKGVKVYPTNGEMFRVPITGIVIASEETASGMFPVEAGLLRLSEKTLMSPKPLTTDQETLYIDAYNSNDFLVAANLMVGSEALETFVVPPIVPPGERATLVINLNPLKEPRSGQIEYTLQLFTSPLVEGETPASDTLRSDPTDIKIFITKN